MLLRIVRRLATWKTWFLIGLLWCASFVLWLRAVEPSPTGYARDCIFITSIGVVVASVAFALATALLLCVRLASKPAWRKLQTTIWNGAGPYRVKGIKRETSAEGESEIAADSRKAARIKAELAGWIPMSLRFMPCPHASTPKSKGKGWLTRYAKVAWSMLAVSAPAALLAAPWSDDWQKVQAEARSVQTDFWSADYRMRMAPGRLGVAVEANQLRRRPRGLEIWSIAFKQSSLMGTFIERAGQRRAASKEDASNGYYKLYDALDEALDDEGIGKLKAMLREYPALRVDLYAGLDAFNGVRSEGMLAYLERRTQAMVNHYRFSRLDESVAVPIAMLAQLPDVLVFVILSAGVTVWLRLIRQPIDERE